MSKAKTREEIAEEYGISRKTLYNWLRKEGIRIKNRLLTPKEQKLIYKRFGKPRDGKGNQDNEWFIK